MTKIISLPSQEKSVRENQQYALKGSAEHVAVLTDIKELRNEFAEVAQPDVIVLDSSWLPSYASMLEEDFNDEIVLQKTPVILISSTRPDALCSNNLNIVAQLRSDSQHCIKGVDNPEDNVLRETVEDVLAMKLEGTDVTEDTYRTYQLRKAALG
ncbi:MAG: hypothetical protein CL565_01485 [Alphaproteobacteria bacterium]|nr:hypothetical protein [Alphaproteobacteria bacterium]|tara:strand:+ start:461 stop:925 length:465 start_codon:yes stop_codon:yes gene_type:complete